MISDTDPRAAAVQLELVRRMTPERRLKLTFSFSNSIIRMSRRAFEARYPDAREARIQWARVHYGEKIAQILERHDQEKRGE